MSEARGISPRSSRIVAAHAAIAGLCPLIPVPFLDDMVIRRITRRMHRALLAAHGLTLTRAGAKALGASPSRWWSGAATSVVLFPIKKLVKKVVYVLAVKDCAEVASQVFHDGWLLAYALELGPDEVTRGRPLDDPESLKRLRAAMLRTYADVDPAPLRRALVGAFLGARVGAEEGLQALRRLLRARSPEPAAPARVENLIDRMRTSARGEWQYFGALEQSFRRHLGLPERRPDLAASGESPQGA